VDRLVLEVMVDPQVVQAGANHKDSSNHSSLLRGRIRLRMRLPGRPSTNSSSSTTSSRDKGCNSHLLQPVLLNQELVPSPQPLSPKQSGREHRVVELSRVAVSQITQLPGLSISGSSSSSSSSK
jgi:hypothetical protein